MENNSTDTNPIHNNPFCAKKPPGIPLSDYFIRIGRYSNVSSECYVLAFVYMEKYLHATKMNVSNRSVHRLVMTSIVIAAKFFDDRYFSNGFYAKVGGLSVKELNFLEREFLLTIQFELYVKPSTYQLYYNQLSTHPAFNSAIGNAYVRDYVVSSSEHGLKNMEYNTQQLFEQQQDANYSRFMDVHA